MFTSHGERNMLGMETIQFQRSHFLVHFFTISRLGGGGEGAEVGAGVYRRCTYV